MDNVITHIVWIWNYQKLFWEKVGGVWIVRLVSRSVCFKLVQLDRKCVSRFVRNVGQLTAKIPCYYVMIVMCPIIHTVWTHRFKLSLKVVGSANGKWWPLKTTLTTSCPLRCVRCVHCNATSPGINCDWADNYSSCGKCASKHHCPWCKRAYKEDEIVMQCQHCERLLSSSSNSSLFDLYII